MLASASNTISSSTVSHNTVSSNIASQNTAALPLVPPRRYPQPPKVIFGIPYVEFYARVIETLTRLTGARWGYVMTNRRVQYVTGDIPVKLAAIRGRTYERTCKYTIDIIIETQWPNNCESPAICADALALELREKLLAWFANNGGVPAPIAASMRAFRPSGAYAALVSAALECDSIPEHNAVSKYDDDCDSNGCS